MKDHNHKDGVKQEVSRRPLIKVSGLHKKFCKDLKFNMLYGVKDLTAYIFNQKPNYSKLRKNEFWALENIDFNIYPNEITALLGTNGSGKTTLIRMLAGIYDMERGLAEYHPDVKKIISIFAIKSGLHPTLTGRENIYLKSAYYGLNKKEIEENLDFIISFSSISAYLDTPLGHYSSGMKTRLAMSIALSIKADVLFVDEGFSFSDPSFKIKCFDFLKKEYTQNNKALIIATHQIGKINNLVNRIILLDNGKIINSTYDIERGLKEYLDICERKSQLIQ